MTREKEFEEIKKLIKGTFKIYSGGLFNTRNVTGDRMVTLYEGKYFTLDVCYYYSYYEIFGTTNEEFTELLLLYNNLRKEMR